MPMKKPTKPSTDEDRNVLVLQAAEHDLPGDDGDGDDEAENHVAEIAAEEAVAVLQFDGGGELAAEIGDRGRVRAVDERSCRRSRSAW